MNGNLALQRVRQPLFRVGTNRSVRDFRLGSRKFQVGNSEGKLLTETFFRLQNGDATISSLFLLRVYITLTVLSADQDG